MLQYAVDIGYHLFIPESEDPITMFGYQSAAPVILVNLFSVLTTVEFYDETPRLTAEISYKVADGKLTPEFHTIEVSIAKTRP